MDSLEHVRDIIIAILKFKEPDSDYNNGVRDAYKNVLEIINAHLEENNDSKRTITNCKKSNRR